MINLSKGLLGLILLSSFALARQDSEPWMKTPEVKDPTNFEMYLKELKERNDLLVMQLNKTELRLSLEELLLDRFMDPLYTWLGVSGPNIEDFSEIKWYLLLIKSENTANDSIWIKFYLTDQERQVETQYSVIWLSNMEYVKIKTQGLKKVLEHHLIQLMFSNKDTIPAMKDGTAHLYRIPTESFDPNKVTKEMLIY